MKSIMKNLIFISILFISLFSNALPSRVLIIRHGEKPADSNDPNLTPQGYQRAQALTTLFQIHPEYASKGLPFAIYASQYIPGKNANRCVETATPLANFLGLKLQTPFIGSDYASLATEILNNPELNDKVVFITWVHGNIPNLARALGGNSPAQWDGNDVYDRVWMIDYSQDGHVVCSDLPESLLPGDSK